MAVLAMAAINGLIMRFLPMLYQSSLYPKHMGGAPRSAALAVWFYRYAGLYNAYVLATVRYISLTTEQPMPKTANALRWHRIYT